MVEIDEIDEIDVIDREVDRDGLTWRASIMYW